MTDEPTIAVFVDFENLALGVAELEGARFEIDLVLKRMLEKGRIVLKRAYCDWSRYRQFTSEFHTAAFEMVDIPQSKVSGKNSADIRMVVDALDTCYAKSHIDTFVLLTGDSDFSPLVSKLKENGKRVVGCGVRNSTSDLLANNCDEFMFYDDLVRVKEKSSGRRAKGRTRTTKKQEAFDRVVETVRSLQEDYDPVWGSLVKQTVRRVYPGFNEDYYGFSSFSDLLREAGAQGLLVLDYDEERGNYRVRIT